MSQETLGFQELLQTTLQKDLIQLTHCYNLEGIIILLLSILLVPNYHVGGPACQYQFLVHKVNDLLL